jgi:glycosyltransferase involved in cell wall biosynthesis
VNKFVFVSPMYNASQTVKQMLLSVIAQSYNNWKIILIDDMSDVGELEKVKSIISDINDDRIVLFRNVKKRWETENVLMGIDLCGDNDIVCRLDPDDYLVDLDALQIIDQIYDQSKCDCLWTMHRWNTSMMNISGALPEGADPYKHPWVSSHLKTFRKRLINGINDVNFRGKDGNYIKRAGDQALFLPILNVSKMRAFLPLVMYHYNVKIVDGHIPINDDLLLQKSEADFLRERGFVA